MTSPIKTLIVDDQPLFQDAMSIFLKLDSSIEVIGIASNGEEALQMVDQLKPEVVLMDLCMPRMGGAEATRQIHQQHPDTKVLVLTTFDEDEEVFEALRAGASGYVLKSIKSPCLVDAIKAVANGGTYLQPSVASQLIKELTRLSQRDSGAAYASQILDKLSQRERDILHHLMQGKINKEIAAALNITEGTVKNHMSSILDKLQVPDRTAAALKVRDLGLM